MQMFKLIKHITFVQRIRILKYAIRHTTHTKMIVSHAYGRVGLFCNVLHTRVVRLKRIFVVRCNECPSKFPRNANLESDRRFLLLTLGYFCRNTNEYTYIWVFVFIKRNPRFLQTRIVYIIQTSRSYNRKSKHKIRTAFECIPITDTHRVFFNVHPTSEFNSNFSVSQKLYV